MLEPRAKYLSTNLSMLYDVVRYLTDQEMMVDGNETMKRLERGKSQVASKARIYARDRGFVFLISSAQADFRLVSCWG